MAPGEERAEATKALDNHKPIAEQFRNKRVLHELAKAVRPYANELVASTVREALYRSGPVSKTKTLRITGADAYNAHGRRMVRSLRFGKAITALVRGNGVAVEA